MSVFGNIGHALAKGVKDVANEAKRDARRLTNNDKPDPKKFTSTQSTMPTQSRPPINTGPQTPTGPTGGSSSGASGSAFTSAQQAQLQAAFSAAGVWDTIQNLGGDIWGAVKNFLPKDASGNVDWAAIGSDVVKWVKDNKDTILSGLTAYEQYQRQQQSDKYAKEGLDLAKQHYEEKAPLRTTGMAGMLNPQANTPDISGLKAQSQNGLAIAAPLPTPASPLNMQNAQRIAGSGSANQFAQPTTPSALPIASPPRPTPGMPTPSPVGGIPGGAGKLPAGPSVGLPVAQSGPLVPQDKQWGTGGTPAPLPVAGPRYLQNGLETGNGGAPVAGGYNALSDYYKQSGQTPGAVDPRVQAMLKQNPNLGKALPVADAEVLNRTMKSVGSY